MRFVMRINRKGIPVITPQCFCNKIEPYTPFNKTCKQFYSERYNELSKIIPFDKALVMFKPFYDAKRMREGALTLEPPAQPAEAKPVDSVTDLLVRNASTRSRRISVRSKLVTDRDSKVLERNLKANSMVSIHQIFIPNASDYPHVHSLSDLI